MSSNTKHVGPHDDCDNPDLHEHGPKLTPAQRSEAFTGSEHYAAGRMTHDVITGEKFNQTQSEVVHDALMAAFQAGFLAAAEGVSVDELLRRMAEL